MACPLLLHGGQQIAVEPLAADEMFFDDFVDHALRDLAVDGGRSVGVDDFDDGFERALAHAADLRDNDVFQIMLIDLLNQQIHDGLGARGDAAGAHADLDAGPAGLVDHLHVFEGLIAEFFQIFQRFHVSSPRLFDIFR
jgi:hypothetical protein